MRINGSKPHAGRVEILYLGVWGTISGSNWSHTDGDVVCRQLGYPKALAVQRYGAFGPGKGPVWLPGFECHGNETRLTHCPYSNWLSSFPGHEEDASVICNSTEQIPQSETLSILLYH